MKFVWPMAGRRVHDPSVRYAVSVSEGLTCGTSRPGSPTVTTSATSVTAKPLDVPNHARVWSCFPP
jgi:hypothetical protein